VSSLFLLSSSYICFINTKSLVLGNGYERKFSDHRVLINHTWTFLSPHTLLEAGNHAYEFELVLPGNLPETTHVDKYYLVQYQLKAVAERSTRLFSLLLPNYTTRRDIHLSRQKVTTDFLDPLSVSNHWANKLDYEINMPTKVYSHGDTIRVSIQALPLVPNLRIRYVACTFKEYMTCRAINGWFNGKNKSHGRIIHYVRQDPCVVLQDLWSTVMEIQIPESMMDIQCDAHNETVRVKHKLKFTVSIENEDGHISELRAVLPVNIAITKCMNGLPAYEESWKTMPYDPVLMMALIRGTETSSSSHWRRRRGNDIISVLPSYSSITMACPPSTLQDHSEEEEDVGGGFLPMNRRRSLPSYDATF
jgi:hypothetical protein